MNNFYNTHAGKAWNKYGKESAGPLTEWYEPFGGQCVSLIKTYLLYLFGDRVKDSYGNAIDFWTGREGNGILKLCDPVDTLQDGDIVISAGSMPQYGHIWIYYQGQALSQNVLDDPRALLYPLSWQGDIYGILRPKKLAKETVKPVEKEPARSVYRLYNPASGDHLYTQSHAEALSVQAGGWKYEGVAWKAPESGDLVMRLCNPYNGIHHFTTDQKEIQALQKLGWNLEGAAFRSGGNTPIYRLYNPNGGQHILTGARAEHDALCKAGWICEGQPLRY